MDIQFADDFWIEAGAMSGPPHHRHQLELPWDLVQFFDSRSLVEEVFPLHLPGGHVHWRPLTYRGTDYGQWTDIWRLGLLTPRMGGPHYAGRIVHFHRDVEMSTDGWSLSYELGVEDDGSTEAASWATASDSLGTTGGHHGRRYGWY